MNKEQKIAEIREALEKIDRGDFSEIAGAHGKAGEWLRFLLDELERLEREYAEERAAHVTELLEKEAKLNQAVEALEVTTYHIQELWKLIPNENFINEMYRRIKTNRKFIERIKGGESDE